MQNNTGNLTIQASLTRLGKRRLTEGKFDITKFAVSDDGINYSLINKNLPEKDIRIQRSPLFNVWADGASSVVSKIPIGQIVNRDGNEVTITNPLYNFGWSMTPPSNVDNEDILITNSKIRYLLYNQSISRRSILKSTVTFPVSRIPLINYNIRGTFADNLISVTLHDNRYFDIGFTQDQVNFYNATESTRDVFSKRNIHTTALDPSNPSDFTKLPKTINIIPSDNEIFTQNVEFVLLYKGNYTGTNTYQTVLTIFCERTGHYQTIILELNN